MRPPVLLYLPGRLRSKNFFSFSLSTEHCSRFLSRNQRLCLWNCSKHRRIASIPTDRSLCNAKGPRISRKLLIRFHLDYAEEIQAVWRHRSSSCLLEATIRPSQRRTYFVLQFGSDSLAFLTQMGASTLDCSLDQLD